MIDTLNKIIIFTLVHVTLLSVIVFIVFYDLKLIDIASISQIVSINITKKKLKEIHNKYKNNDDYDYIFDYGNLSCPYEWSKYSCMWQEKEKLFHQSQYFIKTFPNQHHLQFNVTNYILNILVDRNIIFIGDSVSRQQFISLTCIIWKN